jgi:CO dehydrogenase/acetyl-CoA synthase alpha subunit
MSGIEIYVKDEKEKAKLIEDYLAPDNAYLKAIEELKADIIANGIDMESPEGKRLFIMKVRDLNRRFSSKYDEMQTPACDACKSCEDNDH